MSQPRNPIAAGYVVIAGLVACVLIFRDVAAEFVATWSIYSHTEGARPWLCIMAALLFARAGRHVFSGPAVCSGGALFPLCGALASQIGRLVFDVHLLARLSFGFSLLAVFVFARGPAAVRKTWPAWLLLFFALPGVPFLYFRFVDPALNLITTNLVDVLSTSQNPSCLQSAPRGAMSPLAVTGLAFFVPSFMSSSRTAHVWGLACCLGSLPLGRALCLSTGNTSGWLAPGLTALTGLFIAGVFAWKSKSETPLAS